MGTIAVALCWRGGFDVRLDATGEAATILAATLLSLRLLEHWFMLIRLPRQGPWQPGKCSRD